MICPQCRRKVYDETGIMSEDALGGASFDDLKAYYGSIFKRVTEEDIISFMVSLTWIAVQVQCEFVKG
jgi:hypothetical protein